MISKKYSWKKEHLGEVLEVDVVEVEKVGASGNKYTAIIIPEYEGFYTGIVKENKDKTHRLYTTIHPVTGYLTEIKVVDNCLTGVAIAPGSIIVFKNVTGNEMDNGYTWINAETAEVRPPGSATTGTTATPKQTNTTATARTIQKKTL